MGGILTPACSILRLSPRVHHAFPPSVNSRQFAYMIFIVGENRKEQGGYCGIWEIDLKKTWKLQTDVRAKQESGRTQQWGMGVPWAKIRTQRPETGLRVISQSLICSVLREWICLWAMTTRERLSFQSDQGLTQCARRLWPWKLESLDTLLILLLRLSPSLYSGTSSDFIGGGVKYKTP